MSPLKKECDAYEREVEGKKEFVRERWEGKRDARERDMCGRERHVRERKRCESERRAATTNVCV